MRFFYTLLASCGVVALAFVALIDVPNKATAMLLLVWISVFSAVIVGAEAGS